MSSQIEKRQRGEWEDLPTDLLPAIAKRLTSIADYFSFRGICNSWRSAATFDNFDTQFPRLPLLLYFTEEKTQQKNISTNLLNLESNIRKRSNLVPPAKDYPYLSCSGWILQSSEEGDVHLTNIVWRTKIKLPDWTTFPGYSKKKNFGVPVIRKMVLSGSPTVLTDVVIMVIWGCLKQLAFCRPGDKSWTIFPYQLPFSDIIYHNGKLYAVDIYRNVVECDIHGPMPTEIWRVFAFPHDFIDYLVRVYAWERHNYLVVESSGKLLIVSRYFEGSTTRQFRIYEIELKDWSFKEIDDLGDMCLFLGLNSSICVERSGELSNSIYFTNTGKPIYSDTGVYRLSDGSIQNNLVSNLGIITFYSPPIWILPSI